MGATFVMGYCWVALYLRYGSLYPVIISQAILGTLMREIAPAVLQIEGDVGPVYYEWLTAGI